MICSCFNCFLIFFGDICFFCVVNLVLVIVLMVKLLFFDDDVVFFLLLVVLDGVVLFGVGGFEMFEVFIFFCFCFCVVGCIWSDNGV